MPTSKELVRFLEHKGFIRERQTGSHLLLRHPESKKMVSVPIHTRDLPKGLFIRILKDAGFSLEEYLSKSY